MSMLDDDRDRLGWWLFAAALAGVVGFVAYSFVGTIVFGLFIYYATRPVYRRINGRIGRPTAAAAVSLFALALPALLLFGYVVVVGARELQELTAIRLPEMEHEILDLVADPGVLLEVGITNYVTADLLERVGGTLLSAADTFVLVAIGLIHLFVMVALAFYLLRDDRRLANWFRRTFADEEGSVLAAYLVAIDSDLKSIFFGNILNAFITGVIGAIVFSVLNVVAVPGIAIPAAVLLGLIAGVASLIPVVGMKLVYVPVAIYLAARSVFVVGVEALWFVGLFLLVAFVVVDTIPDLILRPYVSGRSLHVGTVMLAYTLGPLLFGWYGLFLMPVLLVLVVDFARIVLPELLEADRTPSRSIAGSRLLDSADSTPADHSSSDRTPADSTGPESGDADSRDRESASDGSANPGSASGNSTERSDSTNTDER